MSGERELFEWLARPFQLNMAFGDHYIYRDTLMLHDFFAKARSPLFEEIGQLHNKIDSLKENNKRLTQCLRKANEQAEHFEREWYLRGDEIEKLKDALSDLLNSISEADKIAVENAYRILNG